MSEEYYDGILLIDAQDDPRISDEEAAALQPIQKAFMESYIANREKMPVEEWLPMEMKRQLPNRTPEEVSVMSQDILTTLKTAEDKDRSLQASLKKGESQSAWLARELRQATSVQSQQGVTAYMARLDAAVDNANTALLRTVTTKSGLINRNPSLDGYIAEQYHAQTFNMNAEAVGSPYRARVLEGDGKVLAKGSVDIVITDGSGKIVSRYQCKYCRNAKETMEALKEGKYFFQKRLVAKGQSQDIPIKTTEVLASPDGKVTSNAFSKPEAKAKQEAAQSGDPQGLDWNDYKFKDIAKKLGAKTGQAALLGAAVGAATNVAGKLWNGEEIDGAEVVEDALKSGADFGVKAAAAGALKVGVEKEVITLIPKGTPASSIANIAFVAVENTKVAYKMLTGALSMRQGVDRMEQVTVSAIAGIACAAKGASVGASVGAVLGPVGAVVGGFVGSAVGYMAGSHVGEKLAKGRQKLRDKVFDTAKKVYQKAKEGLNKVKETWDMLKKASIWA